MNKKLTFCIVTEDKNARNVQTRLWMSRAGLSPVKYPKYADVLVFTGGQDIQPSLYSQPNHKKTYFYGSRDSYEKSMFDLHPAKFKVGICRGGQMLNVLSGGSMVQHVLGGYHLHDHDIRLTPLYEAGWGGPSIIPEVVSTHHQLMIPSNLTFQREILATAWSKRLEKKTLLRTPDQREVGPLMDRKGFFNTYTTPDFNPLADDAEVIYYKNTGSLCIQGHPERQSSGDHFKTYARFLIYHKYQQFQKHLKDTAKGEIICVDT